MNEFSLTIGDTTWSISTGGYEAWYQSGDWPLIGAIGTLAVSNAVAIFLALYQQRASRKASEDFSRRSTIEKRLEEFYDPLMALLSENREVFSKFGPSRIAKLDGVDATVAAEVWNEMKLGFIVPNNERISSIIQSKSHLISEGDDFEEYLRLKLHIDSYSVFLKVGSEVHESFRFPTGIEKRVSKFRAVEIGNLEETKG
nr:hypothetical protein [uncultured Shimia sp.]